MKNMFWSQWDASNECQQQNMFSGINKMNISPDRSLTFVYGKWMALQQRPGLYYMFQKQGYNYFIVLPYHAETKEVGKIIMWLHFNPSIRVSKLKQTTNCVSSFLVLAEIRMHYEEKRNGHDQSGVKSRRKHLYIKDIYFMLMTQY